MKHNLKIGDFVNLKSDIVSDGADFAALIIDFETSHDTIISIQEEQIRSKATYALCLVANCTNRLRSILDIDDKKIAKILVQFLQKKDLNIA